MEQSQVGVTQSVSQTERRIQESTSAYDRLIRQLDPAAAAQARFGRETEKVNRWLEQGRITAEQHARAMTLLNQRYGAASVAAQQFGAANENAGNTGRRLGQTLGQAGFQVQDFASQIAGGQSALVAFGQQGSQLLGIFGPAGAIAGALLTVGVLALQLSGTAESVRDLSRANEELIRDWQKLQDLGDTEADAQTRRIERNREEARSIYERVKASLTLSEDVLFRQLRDEQNAVDEARAQVAEQRRLAAAAAASPFTRDGTPATPINDNAIATAEARVQRTQTLVGKLQADLARVEREFDRALTNIDAGAMNRGDERVRSLRAAGDATADLARAERERIALANQIERDLQDAIERENALVEARRTSAPWWMRTLSPAPPLSRAAWNAAAPWPGGAIPGRWSCTRWRRPSARWSPTPCPPWRSVIPRSSATSRPRWPGTDQRPAATASRGPGGVRRYPGCYPANFSYPVEARKYLGNGAVGGI